VGNSMGFIVDTGSNDDGPRPTWHTPQTAHGTATSAGNTLLMIIVRRNREKDTGKTGSDTACLSIRTPARTN
jgi:hypothetical protein